ncbi:hypothetical protein EUTSA_v10018101mg [Eutrema salsugineum]|uniref:Uncharacterized protein n=1 Tax=Eutrema salsugineum TaxID=72664 RepID=V4KLZ7_EUTSA|nr:uncharacterized protein LOC18008219 [Eutrema salsugineum]XP_024007373.1 uncharacterized protein LOC18008219 [Eutrema salsugineum]XP_024007421.1 uncharacterized protein LOC18008219 [Eutrema salsugineum]XP_024007452.1 uncharacterized protein LOC18008219 [Eutrema salsugineum]XP_024007473.1 uncharacterized protein LOC18008219 [Eutrema salsugineum]XP_024007498.1 uncharacterized protein LOC18008219 [Eutrema salsugineum]XP_024007516.1 uncharacterized protein LOC18008219 [Eutrema salsugineum]ESQ2
MGEMVHCESFLPSMRDHSEDSNSCSWSMYCGDKNLPYGQYQNGFSVRAAAESYSGYERDLLKQTMLEHEAVFKNQVYELHRLYRTQKSLMDEVKGKNFVDHMNQSERTPESAIKRDLPGFLLGNGEGSSSQACNVPMQNGISSKGEEVVEVRPVKVRRKMIDLQLPADEYLDTDCENTSCPPYEQSKAGNDVGEKLFLERGKASSGSSLVMKNSNGLTDLNEPVQCQQSVPVPSFRDMYSLHGRNVAHVQGQCTSQNGWMVLEAGHGKSTSRDKLCLPSHSVQVLSNNAFQPLGYPSTDQRKLSGEWEARQRNPEVSYDSYVESSVASNAPSLYHGYRPETARPWSHWISSWENQSSSSVQKSLPLQTNPFLKFNTQARADSSSEMRSGLYQGLSSGSKESAFNFPSGKFNHLNNGTKGAVTNGSLSEALKHGNLQRPKMQDCSAGLPWIKPKPPNKNGLINGGFDLNASANQFMDGSEAGDGSNNLSPHNGLRSFSCSNDANLGQVEMAGSQSNRKMLGFSISQKHSNYEEHPSLIPSSVCITDQRKEVSTFVKRNLDINLPCEASVYEAVVLDKKEDRKAATDRHYIDLNLCASEGEDSGVCSNPRVETKATTLIDLEAPPTIESEEEGQELAEKVEAGDSVDELIKSAAEAIVTISLSHHCSNIDEAASSSTDAVAKDPLSWFVNTLASWGNDLEKKLDTCLEAKDCEGVCREECSSGEFDYFEAMTLNLPQTKEEDYMPTPLVPEYLNFDGTESMGITANRPRRGQARRGRPRRDFQRDILPGLASLSRLEVTEDLQMFGGLVKATGYNWNSGVARRSSNRGGSSRGRKRLVSNIDRAPVCSSFEQPINGNSVQMVGLEDRSLTGWGNATRRPRRQRCPAGTPPTVILT